MENELFLFVFLYVFITLIDLGAQIRGAQTRYTVVNFGLNQRLVYIEMNQLRSFVRCHVLKLSLRGELLMAIKPSKYFKVK